MSGDPPPTPSSPPLLPIPLLDYRWVHAGAQHLDLLPTPITAASTAYKSFNAEESFRIEERWESMTEEERRQAVTDWGATEGEGAPKLKDRAKDKDKDKDKAKRRGSNASVDSGKDEMPDHEVLRSGEEQKEAPSLYKDFLTRLQRDYDDLELIAGVPVSQVGKSGICVADGRIRCLRFRYPACLYIRCTGTTLDRGFPF
jgi:hypothetical protein